MAAEGPSELGSLEGSPVPDAPFLPPEVEAPDWQKPSLGQPNHDEEHWADDEAADSKVSPAEVQSQKAANKIPVGNTPAPVILGEEPPVNLAKTIA